MKSCDIPQPERIPLPLNTIVDEVPIEFSQAINQLKLAASENLFLWKEFPVELPESIINVSSLSLRSFFSAPDFNECELLSRDAFGNLKPLNGVQLAQLRRYGEFNVNSSNFTGEFHTWRVSSFLLKGTVNIKKTFKKDLYQSLAQLVIHSRDRISGNRFSVRSSFLALFRDFTLMLIDLLFGWPCINNGDVDQKLLEERLRFITCELSVKSTDRKRVMDFWDTYEQLMCLPRDSSETHPESYIPPYRFITPARIPIDLRLHVPDLLDNCLSIIEDLRQIARIGWFQSFKEQTISRLRDEGKSLTEIKRLVRQQGLREYASRLFHMMRQSPALHSVCEGIAEPLVQQATFSLIVAEAKEAFADAWLAYQESADRELQMSHPILYHVTEWRSRRLSVLRKQYLEAHKLDVHEMVLQKCVEAGLDQHAFFVSRDLTFLRDREHLLREQLEKSASFPDAQFSFCVPAQLPRYWRVYRKSNVRRSSYELIDTVVVESPSADSSHPTSVKRVVKRMASRGTYLELSRRRSFERRPPRADQELGPEDFEVHTGDSSHEFHPTDNLLSPEHPSGDESHIVSQPSLLNNGLRTQHRSSEFVAQSNLVYRASTRYFMWRWMTFFVCTYSWLIRFGQLFLITIPFRSAFSLTAIFKPSPIYLKLQLDPTSGYLFYDKSCYQDTLISRIQRIWRDIRASRHAFDMAPSEGMLDKTAARPLHFVWSYVFRGFLTSLLLLIVWSPACIIISIVSLLLGLTLPVIIPVISLLLHLLGIVFWDAYKPASRSNRLLPLTELIIGHLLIRFLLQLVLSSLTAVVICPACACVLLLWAFLRAACRSIWDFLVFHLVLRNWARIPSREDFMVKRIAGPGTADNHFYRARPVDILVILVCQLELLELSLWRCQMETLSDKPMQAYRRLVSGLSWLSVVPKIDGELYSTLNRSCKGWRAEIQTKTDERFHALQIHLKSDQLQRIKLSDRDLHHTLRLGTELTESFFQTRIAPRLYKLSRDRIAWWSKFGLGSNDYLGLCTTLLGRTFGEQVFTCITETDTIFPLQVRQPSLTKHFQKYMIDMVDGWRSACALDSTGSPQLRDSEPNNEDVLSLASDAQTSSCGLISQRCTVIAATPSKHDNIAEPDSALSMSVDKDLPFVFPETLRTNQHRAVPDPIAFIHVDLPLFPLSAFAPLSYRTLPSPLRSSPKLPLINTVPFLECTGLEKACLCCICPTTAPSDYCASANLTTNIVSFSDQKGPSSHNVSLVPHSHPDGLATLLIEEEKELRRQLFGWPSSTHGVPSAENSSQDFAHFYWETSSLPPTLARKTSTQTFHSFFTHLFSCAHSRPIRQPSVLTVVRHLGRVYHPAIITLLMHARDREQSPLDLSHPMIQAAVNQITAPQSEFHVLQRIKCYNELNELSSSGPPYRSQVALSADSEVADDRRAQHSSDSVTAGDPLKPEQRFLPKEPICRNITAFNRNSAAVDVQGSNLIFWPRRGGSVIEISDCFHGRQVCANAESRVSAFYRQSATAEPGGKGDQTNSSTSGGEVDRQEVPDWIHPQTSTKYHWSGFGSPIHVTAGQEESEDTPTGSLYATEDAATTDDLDETVDTVSLSSQNQPDFMESMFLDSSAFAFFPQPVCNSLAIPQLLVTSVSANDNATIQPLSDLSIQTHVPPSPPVTSSVFFQHNDHRRCASSSPPQGYFSTECTFVHSDPHLLQSLVIASNSQSQPDLVKDVSRQIDTSSLTVVADDLHQTRSTSPLGTENVVSGIVTVSSPKTCGECGDKESEEMTPDPLKVVVAV